MKHLTMNLMIAATALVAAAGSASAQTASTQTMQAKIPFAFRASGFVLPAGTYKVDLQTMHSGDRVLVITTAYGKHDVVAVAHPNGPASGNPVLSFQCGVSRCALTGISMGADSSVYRIPVKKLGKDEPVHTAEIVLTTVKGD